MKFEGRKNSLGHSSRRSKLMSTCVLISLTAFMRQALAIDAADGKPLSLELECPVLQCGEATALEAG